MLETTVDVIKAGLKSDPTITPRNRVHLLALLRHGPNPPKLEEPPSKGPKILPRALVAERMNRSLRLVDRLAQDGTLKKVRLPGRTRACGFLESDVNALLSGGEFAVRANARAKEDTLNKNHES